MPKLFAKSALAVKSLSLATVLLVLSACGTDNNEVGSSPELSGIECTTGSISGAGSTFVQTILTQWVKDYSNACSGATVNYQGVGSGAGISQFNAGTVDFAGTDVPLTDAEKATATAKHGGVVQVPWSSGGIAVEYRLSGVPKLQLSAPVLAAIFAGQVTKWNDPRIASDNPGVSLPSTGIQAVHRSDGSGTTAAFTAYLAAAAPDVWKWGSAKDIPWPTGQGAKGSDGVTAAVKSTEGAIGYAELSFPKSNGLGIALIKNVAGNYVSPEGQGPANALREATLGPDLSLAVNYQPTGAEAYPISTVTYVVAPAKPADPAKAKLLESFISYALGGGQLSAEKLFYAPLPETVVTPAEAAASAIAG